MQQGPEDRTRGGQIRPESMQRGFLQQRPGLPGRVVIVSRQKVAEIDQVAVLFANTLGMLVPALAGTAVVLHEHPDQRAALASDVSMVPGGVEECLRWVTPVHAFCRTATEDTVVADVPIAAGDYLCMLYASGNRDERVFGEDAARFEVRRPANPMHVAFGFGEHVCLGASLARLEARIFVEELLERFPRYEVAGRAERVRSTTVAGIRSLPVVLAPGG